jgi:nitrite reductase (cytochrome c-552)
MPDAPTPHRSSSKRAAVIAATLVGSAAVAFLAISLLTNIFQRKQEAKNPYLRLVEVTDETTDSTPWGMNWARQYDGYRRTADVSRTQYGGSEALPD